MAIPLHDFVVVNSILLSAGTYLFDFGSNLVVLVEYFERFMSLSRRKVGGVRACDATCQLQTADVAAYSFGLLATLVCNHSLNGILFKVKFTHSDAPLCAAYFLPLIHLYRLSNLIWRTLSCKGVQDLRSPEMNGLYCILGSAMEGVPMLIVQFCGHLVLSQEGVFLHSMPNTFKISVAASLISAAYNGGTSVQSIAKNAITPRQKLAAGAIGAGFTIFAVVVRSLTFTDVIVFIREYSFRKRTVRQQAKLHVFDLLGPLLVITCSIVSYLLHYWLLHSPKDMMRNVRNLRRLLSSLSFSYMSMIVGPLYPMTSLASDAHQLGCWNFHLKLLVISLLHVLLDVVVLCFTFTLGTLPTDYFIMAVIGTAGYLVFLVAYIRFDACCGPERGSTVPAEDEDGDGGGDNSGPRAEDIDGHPQETGHGESPMSISCCKEGPSFPVQDVQIETEKLLPSLTHEVGDGKELREKGLSCLSVDRRDMVLVGRGRAGLLTACSSLDRSMGFKRLAMARPSPKLSLQQAHEP
ncbi:hypothetical protein GOP47_0021746 [Adiantum capillus-veneris]|uniref:Uncharacterized protein n=1 Tax=Adiantum capillus-veneris TaxID=13818 RepID=A0A9D4U808_ADICA|nr:hypothetical protein GOP47_0021746 [Adiantum capillus-veneris]